MAHPFGGDRACTGKVNGCTGITDPVRGRRDRMHGRWRLFRHDAGRVSGPPPWAYVALFAACLLIGLWSAETFDAVVIWPANGEAARLKVHGSLLESRNCCI